LSLITNGHAASTSSSPTLVGKPKRLSTPDPGLRASLTTYGDGRWVLMFHDVIERDEGTLRNAAPAAIDAARVAELAREAEQRDEEEMKARVRAHLAEVELELRSHTDGSLALAAKRAHDRPTPVRLASR
jgi:hypothetical protein